MKPLEPVYFLLVDDLEENLLALEALLRRDGLVLLKARSGIEALEILLERDIALALLDVQMPDMDGFELAELMRGIERTKRVPIIFLTAARTDQQRRFRGYEAGAVDFLEKPIEPDILRGKTEVFFDLYRERQEVARQRDELKAASEENARLLQETREYAGALEDADRRKDEFLATLAHELRNPLAPIRNGLQILQGAPRGEQAEKVRGIMERQLSHMVRLIDDLLDMSRISKGKIELRRERVKVQDVVRLAIETSRPQIENAQHTLDIDLPAEPLWIDADMTRIAQALGNLLNNAAKYTPNGGTISLAATQNDGSVSIAVRDNGVGIPKEMLGKVFELFTQVEHAMEHSRGGLGIGLSLSKNLIEMHGGTIEAESAGTGQGSCFTITLPLADSVAPDIPVAATPAQTTSPLKVLVVDDNAASAQTTAWMLEALGHKPTIAYDGMQALSAAREVKPDAVLLDIGLPQLSGYDVCRMLRQDPLFEKTLIVAQTGWGQERDREKSREAGFDHHLVKPVDLKEFASLLAGIESQAV